MPSRSLNARTRHCFIIRFVLLAQLVRCALISRRASRLSTDKDSTLQNTSRTTKEKSISLENLFSWVQLKQETFVQLNSVIRTILDLFSSLVIGRWLAVNDVILWRICSHQDWIVVDIPNDWPSMNLVRSRGSSWSSLYRWMRLARTLFHLALYCFTANNKKSKYE